MHVGPHKTGSTSLQCFLAESEDELRSLGIEYCAFRKADETGHHSLVNRIRVRARDLVTEGRRLKMPRLLLSTENFMTLDACDFSFLFRTLAPEKIKIIFLKRPYCDLLPSIWQESIKHGSCESAERFLLRQFVNPLSATVLGARPLGAGQLLCDLGSHHQSLEVKILDYASLSATADGLLRGFWAELSNSGQLPVGTVTKTVNQSLSHGFVEVLRCLNAHLQSAGLPPGTKARDILIRDRGKYSTDLEHLVAQSLCNAQPYMLRSSMTLNTLEAIFFKDLGLRKSEFGQGRNETFFAPYLSQNELATSHDFAILAEHVLRSMLP